MEEHLVIEGAIPILNHIQTAPMLVYGGKKYLNTL